MRSPNRSSGPPSVSVAKGRQTTLSDGNARGIARLAARQWGHVTRAQFLGLGLTVGQLRAQVQNGHLIRVHHGVYAVGYVPVDPRSRAAAALLAAGPRAVLAGRSAAALWELHSSWPKSVELTGPQRRRIPGVVVRETTKLTRKDIRTQLGLKTTSPARTLLDLAPQTPNKQLHRFHNELRMRNLINNEHLIDIALRNPLHPGARKINSLAHHSQGAPKRSMLEIDWAPFAKRHRLPLHRINVPVQGKLVDVLFLPDLLIVELDGWGTHGTRHAYEQDRDRDSLILAATNIPTIRITKHALRTDPRQQAQRIIQILHARQQNGRKHS